MIHVVDVQLRQEAREFSLRFTCEWCAWFDGTRCSHGYPHHDHEGVDLETASYVTFCKEFELE